jgi:RNA polymerase sigma-70 factor (ECF subfamily)
MSLRDFNALDYAPSTFDDAELLRRIGEGDNKAFRQFYDRHAPLAYSVALKILANPTDAGDVVQDVFVTVHRKSDQYHVGLGKASSWLAAITRNRSLDRLRVLKRQSRHALLERENAIQEFDPCQRGNSDNRLYRDERELLREAVSRLGAEHRQALHLVYFGGMTHQEIAQQFNLPLGTIKARVRRGLQKLRGSLKGRLQPLGVEAEIV